MKDQLQADEEILFVAHPSRIPLIPSAALAVLALICAGVAFYYDQPWPTIVGIVVAFLAMLRFVQKLIVLSSNKYVLTNRRVIRQSGILTHNSVDSYLDKINNVEHRQTLFGRMLGYGDVEIDTASETGMTRFLGIADPLKFKAAVLGGMEQYRAMRYGGVAARPTSGAEKIRELKALLDEGLISAEEYEAKRKELLATM